jgi:hypothetical protein
MEQTITQNSALYLVQRKEGAKTNGNNGSSRRLLNFKIKSASNGVSQSRPEAQSLYRDNGR